MYKHLKEVLEERKITYQEVADALEIKSLSTMNLKINNKARFTFAEAIKLRDLINSKGKKQYTLEYLFETYEQ